jgi:hypothetical protein
MKTRLLVPLVGLAISFALPTFAQEKETVDPQLIQKLYDTLSKEWNEARNNHDATAIAALYTDKSIDVIDSGPLYGRQAIEKFYADNSKGVATQKPYQHDRSAICPHVRARQFNARGSLERDW